MASYIKRLRLSTRDDLYIDNNGNFVSYDAESGNFINLSEECYKFDGYNYSTGEGNFKNGDGYNRFGYKKDENGVYRDRAGYDMSGYKPDKYGIERDRYGYDKNGYDKDGYDEDGYDRDGFDKNGYDRDGKKKFDPHAMIDDAQAINTGTASLREKLLKDLKDMSNTKLK